MSDIEIRSLNGYKLVDETARQMIVNLPKGEPDWNAKEGEEGYIKNRTHYEEKSLKEFFNTSLSLDSDGIYEIAPSPFFLQENNYYRVMWDGITYDCIAHGNGTTYIGNQEIAVNLEGWEFPEIIESNEPFFIATTRYDENNTWSTFYGVEGNHTIILSVEDNIIHKIDEKYLPKLNSIGEEGSGYKAEIFNNYEYNTASGDHSHAEGLETQAEGDCSHAEGEKTYAYGSYSHAEGYSTTASGGMSHAEGASTKALGYGSHAEGDNTKASGWGSHAEGKWTITAWDYQHAQGKYNLSDTTSAHIVGNGTSDAQRSNAHTLDWQGNAWYSGDVYVGSTSGTNRDEGSKKLATEEFVSNTVAAIPTPDVTGQITEAITNLDASDVGAAPSEHTQAASTITEGTFGGTVAAKSDSQDPDAFLLRNSKFVSTRTAPSVSGEICWLYE